MYGHMYGCNLNVWSSLYNITYMSDDDSVCNGLDHYYSCVGSNASDAELWSPQTMWTGNYDRILAASTDLD